jgi:hypothetical protein
MLVKQSKLVKECKAANEEVGRAQSKELQANTTVQALKVALQDAEVRCPAKVSSEP